MAKKNQNKASTPKLYPQLDDETREELLKAKEAVEQYMDNDYYAARRNAEKVLKIAKQHNLTKDIIQGNFDVGKSHYYLGSLEVGLNFFLTALKYAKNNSLISEYPFIYNAVGVAHRNLGSTDKALEYYFKASEFEKTKAASSAYNNIAVIYNKREQFKEAMTFFNKSLDISYKIKDYKAVTATMNNLGNVHRSAINVDSAIEHYLKAQRIAKENNLSRQFILSTLNIGSTYVESNRIENGIRFLNIALELAEEKSYIDHISAIHRELAGASELAEDFEQAEVLYLKSLSIAKKVSESNSLIVLENLSEFYARQSKFRKALEIKNEYLSIKDRISNQDKEKIVANLQIEFETKEKEKEIDLLTRRTELQKLLIEKSKEVEQQNIMLRQANDDLKQFTYAASHDLREPLRMITSFSQILQERYYDQLDGNAKEYFDYIVDGSKRMNNLMEDLLKYATIDTELIEREEVDLNEVIDAVKKHLHLKMLETRTEISISRKLPTIKAYRSQLVQLFMNLVSNAIKFRKEDVSPLVTIKSRKYKQKLTISIADNGIGIEDKHKEKVFALFQRLHSREKFEGTGIGLAVCQKIATRLGGEIRLESKINKGTTFYLVIPL